MNWHHNGLILDGRMFGANRSDYLRQGLNCGSFFGNPPHLEHRIHLAQQVHSRQRASNMNEMTFSLLDSQIVTGKLLFCLSPTLSEGKKIATLSGLSEHKH